MSSERNEVWIERLTNRLYSSSKRTDVLLAQVAKLLEAMIVVLLETSRPGGKPLAMKDRIRILSTAGLRPTEVASLLSISPQNVSVVLYEMRKKKSSKAKPKVVTPPTVQPSVPQTEVSPSRTAS